MGAKARYVRLVVFGIVLAVCLVPSASAMRFSSTDYVIDAATLGNVGGYTSSTNYQLTGSGGEAAIGNGASGSYKMAAGYVAQIVTPAITVKTQPSGLVGYYPLDENSGTVAHDNSSNTNLGSFVGTPTWATGKIGQSLTFDGSTQAVNLANPTATQLTTGTVELWMKSSASTGTQTMLAKYGAWLVGMSSGKPIIYNFATSTTCTGTANIADNAWHSVVVTLQNGVTNGSIIYVDGVQNQTCTWTPQNQTGTVSMAAQYNGTAYSQYFGGSIDQVKIFNRALSAQEVAAEYSAQNAGVETGLTLQTIIAGASNTSGFDVITLTSGSSYTLAISQDHDLKSGSYTIPPISASIASPAAWSEGTTKGLGFTLVSTNATPISGVWNAGASYAALPASATSFYTRTGTQSSAKDVLNMRLRLDATTSQASGAYSNTMTITGTANP